LIASETPSNDSIEPDIGGHNSPQLPEFTATDRERSELSQCLPMLRKDDALIVWKLDRLARSLNDLVEIVQDLQDQGIGFKPLTDSIEHSQLGARPVFHIFES